MADEPRNDAADAPTESGVASAVDMPRTAIALVAAWVVPGLGHAILGRVRRGVLFAVLIWGSFGLGLAHDGRLALRTDQQPFLTSLQIIANLGVGPADLVARAVVYGGVAFSMPPAGERTDVFRERARSSVSIYGTAYLWTAGLMNLLLLFDVWDIGRGRKS